MCNPLCLFDYGCIISEFDRKSRSILGWGAGGNRTLSQGPQPCRLHHSRARTSVLVGNDGIEPLVSLQDYFKTRVLQTPTWNISQFVMHL